MFWIGISPTTNDTNNNLNEQGEHLERRPEILQQGEHLERRPEILQKGYHPDHLPEILQQGDHPECPPESQNSGQHLEKLPNANDTENNATSHRTAPRGDNYNYRHNPPSKRHSDYVYYDTY